uniref:Uncharacterized protein n=1 Tax=Lepeophtheirus salmonis TaxID=72036 RepID=A0A0K2UBA9_LEPSM
MTWMVKVEGNTIRQWQELHRCRSFFNVTLLCLYEQALFNGTFLNLNRMDVLF